MDAFSCDISPTSSGDYDSAMDVLKMAITLIKQSVTAGTEASQVTVVKDVHTMTLLLWYHMIWCSLGLLQYAFCFFGFPQILIHSLQDCVRGIDEQAANTK